MADALPSGEPYSVIHEYDENDRDRNLVYLLPDGTHHRVLIQVGYDNPALRAMIGDALHDGKTGLTRKARNGGQ